ncbi:hypothetical protein GQ53DRAFT_771045 [Thozetella sp. PMI_491]|nr:hypothetical protein GQ53DRAFT_771045 [Thozetella sp. PMI_491]
MNIELEIKPDPEVKFTKALIAKMNAIVSKISSDSNHLLKILLRLTEMKWGRAEPVSEWKALLRIAVRGWALVLGVNAKFIPDIPEHMDFIFNNTFEASGDETSGRFIGSTTTCCGEKGLRNICTDIMALQQGIAVRALCLDDLFFYVFAIDALLVPKPLRQSRIRATFQTLDENPGASSTGSTMWILRMSSLGRARHKEDIKGQQGEQIGIHVLGGTQNFAFSQWGGRDELGASWHACSFKGMNKTGVKELLWNDRVAKVVWA